MVRGKKKGQIIILREVMSMALKRKEFLNTHKIFMKEHLKMMYFKGKVLSPRLRGGMLEDFTMDCNMDMESFTGRMEVSIEETTAEEPGMAMANSLIQTIIVFAGVFGTKEP